MADPQPPADDSIEGHARRVVRSQVRRLSAREQAGWDAHRPDR